MATVTKTFNHEETQRRVRHPLQVVRKYIRRYVFLEGVALTLLCLTGLFWVGLAFDYGMYKFGFDLRNRTFFHLFDLPPFHVHGVDWILELNEVDTSGFSSLGIRVIFLTAAVIGILFLGITKVVVRWVREFNDRAIALVLERRFHKELGDRLITAVELADPKLSKKYGYSQAMVEKTIGEAVHTLSRLPVAGVFNWTRLVSLWLLLGFSTLGIWMFLMVVTSVGSLVFADSWISPYGFAWRFYDVASIWTEREVLMMNSYWPRSAYLEVERFQPCRDNASEMRIPRDNKKERPELQVRALVWVVADRSAPLGWRSLTWADLPKFVDNDLLQRVKSEEHSDWKVDPEDLEPSLVSAVLDNDSQPKTRAEARAFLDKAEIKPKIEERRAQATLDKWLDWHEWTYDKIDLQRREFAERQKKIIDQLGDRKLTNEERWALQKEQERLIATLAILDPLNEQLEERAASASMSRTLRKLTVPTEVDVYFVGDEKTPLVPPIKQKRGNRFPVRLDELKDSTRFRFRARGEDFFTAPKHIVLVPDPAPASITIDKEEPAYIMHRLHGSDQTPLANLRHVTRELPQSTTGKINSIEVPLGTDLVIHVQTDRKLHPDKNVIPGSVTPELGYDIFRGKIEIDKDSSGAATGFSIYMNDLTRKHDFVIEFIDEDNIRGRRHFKVIAVMDGDPQVSDLSVAGYKPRRPTIKPLAAIEKENDKERKPRDMREYNELANSFLITPKALVPFECLVKDDYGLVRVGYQYKLRLVDFELTTPRGKQLPTQEIKQAFIPSDGFEQFLFRKAGKMKHPAALFDYLAKRRDAFAKDKFEEYKDKQRAARDAKEIDSDLKTYLAENEKYYAAYPFPPQPWEFDFKEDRGFDVSSLNLGAPNQEKAQLHYHLQISVLATDNNVETSKDKKGTTGKNKNGHLSFLVVSENELLSQIALEEATLQEKLELIHKAIDQAITRLKGDKKEGDSGLIGMVGDKNVDMDIIFNRMNEIRTALGSAGNSLRDVNEKYENIQEEMIVNRVHQERLSDIQRKIIVPLRRIVKGDEKERKEGSYSRADTAFQDSYQLVEDDVSAKRIPDGEKHRNKMAKAAQEMEQLNYDIKLVLDAMMEGVVESKLIALLVSIEQEIRDNTSYIERLRLAEELRQFQELIGDEKKKK